MVGREVELRFELVLWSRDGAPELEREMVVSTFGWALKENEKTPFTVRGSPRLEVGNRYLAPWVHTVADGWLPQADTAILQVDESLRARRHALNRNSPHDEAINVFVGKAPEEIVKILEATPPDPVAEQYLHLRPQERYKAVVLETELPDRPGYLKAATEGSIYDAQLGYVRQEDWKTLQSANGVGAGIPLFGEDGTRRGTITRNNLVLSA